MACLQAQTFLASCKPVGVRGSSKISLTTCHTRPAVSRPFGRSRPARKSGPVCQASSGQEPVGLDGVLGKLAEKYENSNNKTAVAAWAGASVSAILFAEWLIHKPGLNILLGFPIQLFGLLLLPGAITKYLVDKESPTEDVRKALNTWAKRLPGLEKEDF